MEDNRVGIIFCPRKSIRKPHKHWSKIQASLDQLGVPYDFVQSENAESVERLAAMLTSNGYQTIVVVGGDSSLNRALQGIMSVQPQPTVALGVIPFGISNDFAAFWGLETEDYQRSAEAIAKHRLRRVDVGTVTDNTGCTRHFLNCVNVGLVSRIINVRRRARRFGLLSSLVGVLMLLFQRMSSNMTVRVGNDNIQRVMMNFCIGSAPAYGITPNAVPYSGLLDVSILSRPALKQLSIGLWLYVTGRFLNFRSSEQMRTRRPITIADTGGAPVSLDGSPWPNAEQPLTVTLKPEHINFIIP